MMQQGLEDEDWLQPSSQGHKNMMLWQTVLAAYRGKEKLKGSVQPNHIQKMTLIVLFQQELFDLRCHILDAQHIGEAKKFIFP